MGGRWLGLDLRLLDEFSSMRKRQILNALSCGHAQHPRWLIAPPLRMIFFGTVATVDLFTYLKSGEELIFNLGQ